MIRAITIRLFRRSLKSIVTALCTDDPRILEHTDITDVTLRCEDFVQTIPPLFFWLFYLTIFTLEFGIYPIVPKILPFTLLANSRRFKCLASWQNSRNYIKRILLKNLVVVCTTEIYSNMELLNDLGYSNSLKHRTQYT